MELKEAREKINIIDEKMAHLFKERMDVVRDVAAYKSDRGLPVEDRERELSLIESKSELIEDEDMRSFYISFLQSTMDISKKWQHRLMNGLRIAVADERHSDVNAVAKAVFPDGNIESFEKFDEAYKSVEKGDSDVAVLPLENSYKGEVGKVYDLIFAGSLFVNGIKTVEQEGSTTKYAILSRVRNAQKPDSDTEGFLIMFTVKDEVGGLAKAINIISACGYNMKVLRSRPMKDLQWHYYFYAELIGSSKDGSEERILRALQASCPTAKVAGHFTENSVVQIEGK